MQNGDVQEILGDKNFAILREMYYKMAMSNKFWELEMYYKTAMSQNFYKTLENVLERRMSSKYLKQKTLSGSST